MFPKIFPRTGHPISRKNIDSDALRVLYRLYGCGHTAYLVGGGVRDMLLGRRPKDFDIATSARPSQIRCLFGNCRLVGRRFRLAHICCGPEKIIEVSTFRRNPEFISEQHESQDEDFDYSEIVPDNTFGNPEEDSKRRDFTVNGLFYDIGSCSIIDYVGGVKDLKNKIVRVIGDPDIRFKEDPVRMLRAIKFCSKLDFKMEKETWKAIYRNRSFIKVASVPRVQEELLRFLEYDSAERCFELLLKSGLMTILMPVFIDYLRRAKDGLVPSDPECEYFWQTLEICDSFKWGKAAGRQFMTAALSLPLFLHEFDNIERKGRGDIRNFSSIGWIQEIVKKCTSCFGTCRHAQDEIVQYFNLLRRMILFEKGHFKNSELEAIVSKVFFQEAFALYTIMYNLGAVDESDFIFWNGVCKKRSISLFENSEAEDSER